MGVERISCGAGDGVSAGVSGATTGGVSLVGSGVTGACGLQPSKSVSIRITATKILRFIMPSSPEAILHTATSKLIMHREDTSCKSIYDE